MSLTAAAQEVEGTLTDSTTGKSSMARLVEASVLLESLKLGGSVNCLREGSLPLLPYANSCPLIFLTSDPTDSCKVYGSESRKEKTKKRKENEL